MRVVSISVVKDDVLSCLKLTEQKPSRNVNLFDESYQFIKHFMYVSLGVLAGLLLIGTLWDNLFRKRRTDQNTRVGEPRRNSL